MTRMIPNLLTTVRILGIFVFYYLLFLADFSHEFIKILTVIIVYTFSALTDYWDGRLSRKFKSTSEFGKFYDSLVDKFFIITIFFLFALIPVVKISFLLIFLIVFRELSVTILRIIAIVKGKSMETEKHGKMKTAFQITAQGITLLILLIYSVILDFSSFNQENFLIATIPLKQLQAIFAAYQVPEIWVAFLENLPNILVFLVTIFTLYSGGTYFYKNKNVFTK